MILWPKMPFLSHSLHHLSIVIGSHFDLLVSLAHDPLAASLAFYIGASLVGSILEGLDPYSVSLALDIGTGIGVAGVVGTVALLLLTPVTVLLALDIGTAVRASVCQFFSPISVLPAFDIGSFQDGSVCQALLPWAVLLTCLKFPCR